MSKITLERIRRFCLTLPDTKETETWGKPHFRVGDKIFCGVEDDAGTLVIGFKLEKQHAAGRVKLPGFERAPYVGHRGWVSMDAAQITDWTDVCEMITESYRLIAPKRSIAKLDAEKPTNQPVHQKKTSARSARKKK